MPDTIFTKIINREIPADIQYEDDDVIAFNDIEPQAPVHILIIPKKPIATINDANDEDAELLGKILLAAKKIAKDKNIAEGGYRLVINTNKDAQQTVFHIHCHLLAGRKFKWPPG
ncbi:MAG: histidine triad nucleotide-binding protein [Candidatus Kapabacteria bacterium]|jgi:histidine triad (HIT) family protein|nr:histidine triad nucleotide-binding protein [Candidatus Kapabacteria bacterium]